jgi:High potential iron-sulfur protein
MDEIQTCSDRRMILARGIRLVGACLLIAVDSHQPATAKTPKTAFLYQDRPHDGQRCGDCKYFSPEGNGATSGTCALVEGVVNRDGWCMAYVART